MAKGQPLTDAQKAEKIKERRAKFAELAGKRLPNAVKALQQIANLASYGPSDAQKEFVLKQLGEAASGVNAAFQGKVTGKATIEVPTE